ncbi:NifB/NifX family molybdenum-iron cluster-binding protein [Aeromonas veronii]|uniref:NifB/NifX family molybdenum-iron cluster-binding protein n=1 Tax=Aeromonas TaxID=642 RepID=UPI00084A5197|nr:MULTISPECIES: NifB/NifX family molybdenum-iron cluster-binding protein [Aeromonas]MCR3970048.1 hypothetical protein [Aeromonas veronii]MCR3974675.1 hypothetical protein [Aeromonas veronii]OEC48994.1 hypothetical protein A9G04_13305 [Aeromonas sp. ANNP30]OEC64218.1 hypothetical protein A9G49_13025 [Aeromonas sp. ANP5]
MTIITAIPMNDDHIAGHFAKAERFVFVDEQGSTLAEIANPVAGNECKSALAELLQAHGARRIVLKNIGSKMLGKLLGSGLAVYQASQGRLAMADMLSNESGNLTELTSAEQGSASRCAEGAGHHGKGSRQCAPRGRLGKGGCCKSASGQQQGCQGNRQRNHKKCCEE